MEGEPCDEVGGGGEESDETYSAITVEGNDTGRTENELFDPFLVEIPVESTVGETDPFSFVADLGVDAPNAMDETLQEDEELEDMPEDEKKRDPLRHARISWQIQGREFTGYVEDIEVGTISGDRLYRIRYCDGDLEHFTAQMVKDMQVLVPAPYTSVEDHGGIESQPNATRKVEGDYRLSKGTDIDRIVYEETYRKASGMQHPSLEDAIMALIDEREDEINTPDDLEREHAIARYVCMCTGLQFCDDAEEEQGVEED